MAQAFSCDICGGDVLNDAGVCARCELLGINRDAPTSFFSDPPIQKIITCFLVTVLLSLLGSHYDFNVFHSDRRNAGMLAPNLPVQSPPSAHSWKKGEYVFTALADYSIEARVILKQNYWLGAGADIAPMDLTLAWGRMSDQKYLDSMHYSSCYRCYQWTAKELLLPEGEINDSIANTHIIPKDEKVLRILNSVESGAVVKLQGYLVSIARVDGWHWTSSLTREDSGDGACEVMWVNSAEIIRR